MLGLRLWNCLTYYGSLPFLTGFGLTTYSCICHEFFPSGVIFWMGFYNIKSNDFSLKDLNQAVI